MSKILEMSNITKRFPGVLAVDNVSFAIESGEVHTLVGENGAGKSTLMKIIAGVHQPDEGQLYYKGEKINLDNPKQAQKLGIGIIHQEFSLVPYFNAVENIFLGKEITKANGVLDWKTMKKQAREVLERMNVELDLDKPTRKLTVAEQQFVEIAKAVKENSDVLILDEPTASLTDNEIDDLFKLLKRLKNDGVTMIFISHHLDEVFRIGDRMTCLRDGQRVGTKPIEETSRDEVVKMMVGRDLDETFPERFSWDEIKDNEIILDVKNLRRDDVVNDVSFQLRKGEILGMAGLVGAGRSEIVRALIGIDDADEKEIYLKGNKVNIDNPAEALNNGIGLLPESRSEQGLVLGMSVKDNVNLPSLQEVTTNYGLISRKSTRERTNNVIDSLDIKTPHINKKVKGLSGGNQQKVVVAKWLVTNTDILIFDEPTRGIDVGAKVEIHNLMRELVNEGMSIIMISSELPEVLGMSDRILTVYKGDIVKEFKGNEATSEKIMHYATGGEEE